MSELFEAISVREHRPAAVLDALSSHGAGQPGAAPALILYFASSRGDFAAIAAAIAERFPSVPSAGCTTCGEVGPAGCTTDGVSIALLHAPARAAVTLVEGLSEARFEHGGELVARLAAQLGLHPFQLDPARHVLLTFTDGLSGAEEVLVASLAEHAPSIPLVGGSAGDDFQFERTFAGAGGKVASNAAAVVLLEPNAPFHPFHLHHYAATERDTVVTDAEPSRRIVRRLDGYPAVRVLADLLQVPERSLREDRSVVQRLAPVFGFRAAGTTHLRSVMNVDGSALLMGGAVESGTVLLQMRAGDLIAQTHDGVRSALQACAGAPSGMLLFSCGGRMWEAIAQNRVSELADAMHTRIAAGFTTYGEQFGALQVNHTLTGLVLGTGA
jgi:hypothetical protein